MPLLGNPLGGNDGKKFNKEELIRALRFNIAGEQEAIIGYDVHISAADGVDNRAVAILKEIRDDERRHVAQLQDLINRLDSSELESIEDGIRENLIAIGLGTSDPDEPMGVKESDVWRAERQGEVK